MRAISLLLGLSLSLAGAACGTKSSQPANPGNVPTTTSAPATRTASSQCVGSWIEPKSSARLVITGPAGAQTCGRMIYPACRGDLTGCIWSGDEMKAHYRCAGDDDTFTGTIDMTCRADDSTVVDDTDGHDVYTDVFNRE